MQRGFPRDALSQEPCSDHRLSDVAFSVSNIINLLTEEGLPIRRYDILGLSETRAGKLARRMPADKNNVEGGLNAEALCDSPGYDSRMQVLLADDFARNTERGFHRPP